MNRRHVTDTYAASQEPRPPPPLPARPSPGPYSFSRSGSCPLIALPSQSGLSDSLPPLRRLHTDCNPLYPTSPGPRLPSCAALGKGSSTGDMAAALDQSDPAKQKDHDQEQEQEQEQQPIDIRARVAAFEKRSDTSAAPPPPPPRKLVYAKSNTSTIQGANGSIQPPPPVSISHGSPARPSVTTQDIISRVNTTPRTRDDLTPGTSSSSPSLRSVPSFSGTTAGGSDSPSEFGVLSPLSSRSIGTRLGGAASTSSSSLPLPSSNGRSSGTSPGVALSPFSAAYKGGSGGLAHTVGPSSSHASNFDALAEAGSVKRVGSGTSLNDLTTSSIARARERSSGAAVVSGKVPLPPPGVPGGSMTNGSSSSLGVFMPSDITGSSSGAGSAGGRASPALPPRSGLASTRGLHKRSSGSLSQISDGHPASASAYTMRRNRSTTESPLPSPSVRSLNPLDDDDNETAGTERGEGGYGLILHPTLKPTTSPVASRPASRASNSRSVPSSPQIGLPEAADLLSVQHRVRVGVQPPTPSPEKHPEGNLSMAKTPYMSLYEPRRNHSIDSTASSSEGKDAADSRLQLHRGQAPSLPPRGGAVPHSSTNLPYVPYKQRAGSGSGLMLSSPSAGGAVASKVPPPPSMPSTSLPTSSYAPAVPPRQSGIGGPRHSTGHSPSASVSSSPAQSPKLAAASKFAQRSGRSGGPSHDAVPRSSGAGPSSSSTGLAAIQPPPSRSRLRSSSEGPLGETKPQHPHDGRTQGHTLSHGAANGEAHHLTPAGANSAPIARDTFHGTLAYRSSQASLHGKRAAAAAGGAARFKPARSLAPADEAARKRYEDVWEREVQRMERRKQKKEGESGSSGLNIDRTVRKAKSGGGAGGGVASLASRFESTSPPASTTTSTNIRPTLPRTSRKPSVPLSITTPSSSERLPARRIGKVWRKSRLPEVVLSQIWLAALAWDRDCEAVLSPTPPEASPLPLLGTGAGVGAGAAMSLGGAFAAQQETRKDKGSATTSSAAASASAGPSKEAFVRALAAIDAELAYRAEGRAQRRAARASLNASVGAGAGAGGSTGTTAVGGVSPAATGAGGGARGYAPSHSYSHSYLTGHAGEAGAGAGAGARRRMPPLAPAPAPTHAGGE